MCHKAIYQKKNEHSQREAMNGKKRFLSFGGQQKQPENTINEINVSSFNSFHTNINNKKCFAYLQHQYSFRRSHVKVTKTLILLSTNSKIQQAEWTFQKIVFNFQDIYQHCFLKLQPSKKFCYGMNCIQAIFQFSYIFIRSIDRKVFELEAPPCNSKQQCMHQMIHSIISQDQAQSPSQFTMEGIDAPGHHLMSVFKY